MSTSGADPLKGSPVRRNFQTDKQKKSSKGRRGIQPTVPLGDATLNDSNVKKFVLPGRMQCCVLKSTLPV